MIFSSVFGKFARFKNLVTRGASYETNTGERPYSVSPVVEMFGHTAQDSGRRVIGVVDAGFPSVIFVTDIVIADQAETSVIQMYSGLGLDTGVPGPPNLLFLEISSADPATGDAEKQFGQALFYRKDGATGAEGVEIAPTNGGRFKLASLPVYADDAAAGAGGETTGVVYQTATGELRIKL